MTEVQPEGWVRIIGGGDRVLIRPLHSQDAEMERSFIEALSPVARRFRFLETMKTPSEELLKQLTVLDPVNDVAYAAVTVTGSREDLIGVGRFSAERDGEDCEFAVTVADKWQQKGLGTLLMEHLIATARARGLQSMHSSDSWDNERMRRFAAHMGLHHARDPDDATQVIYSLDLKPLEPAVNIAAPP